MKNTARPTLNMTPQCGAGKIDALAGLKEALNMSSGLGEVKNDSFSDLIINVDKHGFCVESACGEAFEMRVYDMVGRMTAQRFSTSGQRVEVSDMASGIYLIEMVTARGKAVKKVIF